MLPEQTRRLTGGADILDTDAKILKFTQEQRDWLEAQGQLKGTPDFGSLSAFADVGPTAVDTTSLPSTVVGLTVAQAQQRARDQQAAFLIEQQRARQRHLDLQRSGTVSTPAPQVQPGIRQRAAGQSQRLERNTLIKLISDLAKEAAILQRGDSRDRAKAALVRKSMANAQQALVNLLTRYRF